ncbi:hypothetical protein [Streptomyces sp. NPDC048650]|uniref:hypothetical protein n=1 Tax=unclassified Streptomyces TaxID=2593676 RepID=UPI003718DAF4
MNEDGISARELFRAVLHHGGPGTYGAVVAPWVERAAGAYRAALARAALPDGWWNDKATAWGNTPLIRELYALSRVNDALLVAFQPAGEAPSEEPWARRLPPPDQWPGASFVEYLEGFTALGMTPFDHTVFDPFHHEIVEVRQADDPDAPIQVTEVAWPGLMLGDLLFSRAGVRVRAGRNHAQRGVADRFPLYWAHRRSYRPAVDLSHGWGSNSQWATDLRLDYRTTTSPLLNVAEDGDIDLPADLYGEAALLTPAERRELLRNRCLLRAPEAASALTGMSGWEKDLLPFAWRLPRPRPQR